MAASNKNSHLTLEDRRIIQKGIESGSFKQSIADTLGKDNSTIGKEIKNHRSLAYSSAYPVDCVLFPKCKNRDTYQCNSNCTSYKKFTCNRRDRSPGACNGCLNIVDVDSPNTDILQNHHIMNIVNCWLIPELV